MKDEYYNYDNDFLNVVFSNLANYESLGLNINNILELSKKEKESLSKIRKRIEDVRLYRDYDLVKLPHFNSDDALLYANYLLQKLFPTRTEQINDLDNLICFTNINYGESGLYYRINDNDVKLDKIIIPEECNGYTISIIVHEKMHALTFWNLELKELFEEGLELLPIFIQKIVLYELENEYKFTYLSDLDSIVRNNDSKNAFLYLDYSKKIKNNSCKLFIDTLVSNYYRIQSINYLKAELYGEILLKKYIEDRNKMIENLNKLIDKKISIKDFLNIYNANFLNKELSQTVKETFSKIKRISIIP